MYGLELSVYCVQLSLYGVELSVYGVQLSLLVYSCHCMVYSCHCMVESCQCMVYGCHYTVYSCHCMEYSCHYMVYSCHYMVYSCHYMVYCCHCMLYSCTVAHYPHLTYPHPTPHRASYPTSTGDVTIDYKAGHERVIYSPSVLHKIIWWYHIVALVWFTEFILACQQFIVGGSVGMWYFTRFLMGFLMGFCHYTRASSLPITQLIKLPYHTILSSS